MSKLKILKTSSILIICLLIFFLSMSYMGSEGFDWWAGIKNATNKAKNSISIRTWALILVGIGLSVAGVAMQGVTSNPLASPYSFGTIASATLGILLVNYVWKISLGIFGNYLLILFITFLISSFILFLIFSNIVDSRKAMVIGLTFSVFISSVNYIIQNYFQLFVDNGYIGILSLASLTITWTNFWISLPTILIGTCTIFYYSKQINIYNADQERAITLSINPTKLKIIVGISAVLISTSVALLVGPIGFVGLVVPHITKLMFRGWSITKQMLLCIPISIILLLTANILVRYFTSNQVNINIILTIISAPIIIYYIMRWK